MRRFFGVAIVTAGLLMPSAALAGPLVDDAELDFTGSVIITAAGMIDWSDLAEIQDTSTLSFFDLIGTNVSETDLDQTLYPAGPVGSFAPLSNFEVLDAQLSTNFTLEAIDACEFGCSAGPTSPFNFIYIGGNTTIIMVLRGTATDDVLNPGQLFTWVGTFSADFPNQSPAQILAELDRNGFVDAPYSAAKVIFQQAVPEPATLLTLGVGLAAVGNRLRRRIAKKA